MEAPTKVSRRARIGLSWPPPSTGLTGKGWTPRRGRTMPLDIDEVVDRLGLDVTAQGLPETGLTSWIRWFYGQRNLFL